MAGKKPWCAEGVCSPAVPMHTKGCARRAAYVEAQAKADAETYDQKPWIPQREEMIDQLATEMDVPKVETEPGSQHFAHYLPTPAPVVEKKPWWKRVFGG